MVLRPMTQGRVSQHKPLVVEYLETRITSLALITQNLVQDQKAPLDETQE